MPLSISISLSLSGENRIIVSLGVSLRLSVVSLRSSVRGDLFGVLLRLSVVSVRIPGLGDFSGVFMLISIVFLRLAVVGDFFGVSSCVFVLCCFLSGASSGMLCELALLWRNCLLTGDAVNFGLPSSSISRFASISLDEYR